MNRILSDLDKQAEECARTIKSAFEGDYAPRLKALWLKSYVYQLLELHLMYMALDQTGTYREEKATVLPRKKQKRSKR